MLRKLGIMCVVLAVSLSAIGVRAEQPPKQLVIGASLISKDNMWWANVGKFLEQGAEARGVRLIALWAQGDTAKQLRDVEDLIQRKVDGILIGPVHVEGSVGAIEAAYKAGIPIVQIGRESATDKYSASFVFYAYEFGVKQAEFLASALPDGGNIVYIMGPIAASCAEDQYDGFMDTITKYPKLRVLHTYKCKVDTMAEGLTNGEVALARYADIHAFAGSNDDLVLGALRAAESAGRAKEIIFAGSSGLPMGMQAIYEGRMHYTSLESQAVIAERGLDAIITLVQGGAVQKDNRLAPIVVTQDNVLTVRDPVFGGTVAEPSNFIPSK